MHVYGFGSVGYCLEEVLKADVIIVSRILISSFQESSLSYT